MVRATGALALSSEAPRFGGLSGLAISADGGRLTMVSDRGALIAAAIVRDDGRLAGLLAPTVAPLRGLDGEARPWGEDDAEALALGPDGALWISFEGLPPRIWRHATSGAAAEALDLPDGMTDLQRNSGLEALATGDDGTLYAIPERSGAPGRPFPVFRRDAGGRWSTGTFPRRGDMLVTGLDAMGDELFALERSFGLLRGGFSWRVSRASLEDWPNLRPETLIETQGGLDNMEGIAAWRAPDGATRLMLVADDNFQALQRTLLLELEITGREGSAEAG